MAVGSNVNPNYPIPGIDQSSRGFRDNFSTIKAEIENLQGKTIQVVGDMVSSPIQIGAGNSTVVISTSANIANIIGSSSNLQVLFNSNGLIAGNSNFTYNPSTSIISLNGNIVVSNSGRIGNLSVTNTTASTSSTTGALVVTGGIGTSGNVTLGAALGIVFSGRSKLQSTSDGFITLLNNANTSFTMLQFGGTTSSFPAIKRSGTEIAFRLADDSANANITAASATFSGLTQLANYVVSALPTAASSTYKTAFVSDSNVVAFSGFGNTVFGGGANVVPVYSDGVSWRIG